MFDSTKIKFNEAVSNAMPEHRDFYDRGEQVAPAVRAVKSQVPVIFIGERRAGKTSVIKYFQNHFNIDSDFIPILVPWQSIHSRDQLIQEILQGIWFELDGAIREDSQLTQLVEQGTSSLTEFIRALQELAEILSGKTLVFLIDEFDSILEDENTPSAEKSKILGLTNALVEGPADLPVKLMLTMTRTPDRLETAHSSPLTYKAEQIRLPPFSKEDLDVMIRDIIGETVPVTEETLQEVFTLSGGWPYFAKLFLKYMASLPPTADWVANALRSATRDTHATQALKHIYDTHFNEAEKTVSLLLAKRGGVLSAGELALLEPSLRTAATRLTERDFLKEQGGDYQYQIGFLNTWFPAWVEFEEEVNIYLKEILHRFERQQNPWHETKPPLTITRSKLNRRGH